MIFFNADIEPKNFRNNWSFFYGLHQVHTLTPLDNAIS